jgi:hypothetical protein
METTDPVAALASKDIAERAAGCRDLSLAGTVEHLELLCHHIGMDRSPGVRLSAAVAAGDILSRCRVGDARKTLSDDQRDVYVAMFSKVDPSLNAGIFPVLACLDRPQSFQMIKGGLRDPRRDVRLGAAVGLMRLCISVSVADDTDFEESVVALLADTRHQPDAIAQIARVCAAAGFSGATEFIRHIQLSGTHAEMVMEALGVLDGGQHPLQGLWYSDGKDAGETNLDSPQGPAVAVFADSGTYLNEGKRWEKKTKWEISRRMFARRVGEQEPGPSFQADGRTFYAGLGAIVDELVGADVQKLGKSTKASMAALEALPAMLDESSEAHRSLALLAVHGGLADVAQAALESAIEGTKTPADCWLLLADLLWEAGQKKGAKENYALYAKKGKKKDNPEGMERAKERE